MRTPVVLAVIATLMVGACGGTDYLPVQTIDQSHILYLTVESPDGAAAEGSPAFNTSCSDPAGSVDGGDVAAFLRNSIQQAIDEEYGVVHLCSGIYETTSLVDFPNTGSITIQGDGSDVTVIRGAGDHSLLLMAPECIGPAEECPNLMNTLTLKDITLSNGVGTVIDYGEYGDWYLGGAVTAPMIRTIRTAFLQNEGACGGAVSLYGTTLRLITDNDLAIPGDATEDEIVAIFSSWDVTVRNLFQETTFTNNSALVGGAIAGIGIDSGGPAELTCLNTGLMDIVNSTFTGNHAAIGDAVGIVGGGAIAAADPRYFLLLEGGDDLLAALLATDRSRAPSLRVTQSVFRENTTTGVGGAILSFGITEIRSSTFISNNAVGAPGGALAAIGETRIYSSDFLNNSASSGGALALSLTGSGSESNLLERSVFKKNVATVSGGAISGWSQDGVARRNQFSSNRSPVGSAVSVSSAVCTRSITRRLARQWTGNTFRLNRGSRAPVECYVEPT